MKNKWNDREVLRKLKRKYTNRLELVGEYVEAGAKLRCTVDTGNLRDSINHKVDKSELSVRIGTPVEYAPYIELGTSRMAAQPFLRPALIESKTEIQKIFDN